jgi:hypothetical protein
MLFGRARCASFQHAATSLNRIVMIDASAFSCIRWKTYYPLGVGGRVGNAETIGATVE